MGGAKAGGEMVRGAQAGVECQSKASKTFKPGKTGKALSMVPPEGASYPAQLSASLAKKWLRSIFYFGGVWDVYLSSICST